MRKPHTKMYLSQLLDLAKRNGLEGVSLYSTKDNIGFSQVITNILHLELYEHRKRKYVIWDDHKLAQVCANYGVPFGIHPRKITEMELIEP